MTYQTTRKFPNCHVSDLSRSSGKSSPRPRSASLNTFVEPQYVVNQSGPGVPSFQVFAGVVVQLPVRLR